MYIVDAPISKPYWEPFYDGIERALNTNRVEWLEGAPICKLTWHRMLIYVVVVRDEIIGWLALKQRKNWVAQEVAQAYVLGLHRGQGWGKVLYNAVIDIDGQMLASGTQQSKYGRRMWKQMIASDQYTIWAHDFRSDVQGPVVYDEDTDELWSPLQLYEEDWNGGKSDVRFVAIKKGKKK